MIVRGTKATYKKKGSMSTAFHSMGVDHNTVARSAHLAEVMLVAPEFLRSQPAFDSSKETPNQCGRRITKNATAEVSDAIKEMRRIELPPITYKFK